MAWKVTIGLASYWPCVTDLSDLFIYRLKAQLREMSTPSTLLMVYDTLYCPNEGRTLSFSTQ